MLHAKAIKFKAGLVGPAEQLLASTDVHGSFAGIPVVVQGVNVVIRTRLARSVMDWACTLMPGCPTLPPSVSAGAWPRWAAPPR